MSWIRVVHGVSRCDFSSWDDETLKWKKMICQNCRKIKKKQDGIGYVWSLNSMTSVFGFDCWLVLSRRSSPRTCSEYLFNSRAGWLHAANSTVSARVCVCLPWGGGGERLARGKESCRFALRLELWQHLSVRFERSILADEGKFERVSPHRMYVLRMYVRMKTINIPAWYFGRKKKHKNNHPS